MFWLQATLMDLWMLVPWTNNNLTLGKRNKLHLVNDSLGCSLQKCVGWLRVVAVALADEHLVAS
jgi:hypothetical protein